MVVAIPFRVGWGFQLRILPAHENRHRKVAIPFRVGWGFQHCGGDGIAKRFLSRNPFQGGVGFSTEGRSHPAVLGVWVAIPFRVGWGFQQVAMKAQIGTMRRSRNPFQGGVGFSTTTLYPAVLRALRLSRNPFQGGVGFSTPRRPVWFSPY